MAAVEDELYMNQHYKTFYLKAYPCIFHQETSLFNGMDVTCWGYKSSLTRNVLRREGKNWTTMAKLWQGTGR